MNPPSTRPSDRPSIPSLELLDPNTHHVFQHPAKRINEGPDVTPFLTTKAYRDIGTFILQLNRSLCPRRVLSTTTGEPRETIQTFPLTSLPPEDALPTSIRSLRRLLKEAESLIDLAPPDPGPRRFGNVSFRKWASLLEERSSAMLDELLPPSILSFGNPSPDALQAKDEITPYLLGSFGSPQRIDYGTGHELSFLAFLACLWKLRFFSPGPCDAEEEEIDRLIVLGVLEPYLTVVRRLILTYTMEPAGSHGVWGLDDHSFLPYIFGSAQLTRPIAQGGDEPMPTEGSVRGAPRTESVVKADTVANWRESNMYFSAIGFINDVKTGPFWEHSPILFDISGVRDGWGKINKGMVKMYNAEVLSKFPVVQHFPFGSLLSWDQDPDATPPAHSIHVSHQPPSATSGTAAPWAAGAATRMPPPMGARGPVPPDGPGIPYSRAPWAGSSSSRATRGPSSTMRPPSLPQTQTGAGPGTGPGSGGRRGGGGGSGSTDAQITITKAPWAK
ncbi:Phosphotyrosyl phosphatase activator [Sodiomyces alkalinus F11]|uniref:Serine/threonine-protein phosphatase 2A activator n=1 Tax=Sodiomyces alkalinus (strain CBS 110278 / VKM F-3762 / F11) TaxID=1314773 RepID=A0A3N2PPR7_SODAK|nr:Phosphotyrosyl phosphatase activator [Sodiomyces alkalinus F11]ROT36502.1 Phosphotyrosyl phosphatase activator [Sodiomyces alkalinus F11]